MGAIIFLVLAFVVYFLPTIVASKNKKKNSDAILILNLFLGWTFVGWIIALVWAVMHEEKNEASK